MCSQGLKFIDLIKTTPLGVSVCLCVTVIKYNKITALTIFEWTFFCGVKYIYVVV